ncbi:hypothetical protein BJP34_19200 [Moorena producens PAL-8-15-08-1]|uniref:Uncharacterized protein n=1 Tax=Moorena producens PAL-8-15-08-1 TaxID=1458985 RepID=A0A1D8TUD9_9CYAN|nr:hypothetical protein BJP34_19200 [Moorena producens PAL-8-15-08-1]
MRSAIPPTLKDIFTKAMQQGNRGGSAVLGRQCGLGGSPHEQLPWFPPLALCMADKASLSYGKFKPLALCMADRDATNH